MKKPGTLVGSDKVESLLKLLKSCESLEGEVWECGVYQGGTAFRMHLNTRKTMRLFDSWEGLPEPSEEDQMKKVYRPVGGITRPVGPPSTGGQGGSGGPRIIERGYGAVSTPQAVGQQEFRPTTDGTVVGPTGASGNGGAKSAK